MKLKLFALLTIYLGLVDSRGSSANFDFALNNGWRIMYYSNNTLIHSEAMSEEPSEVNPLAYDRKRHVMIRGKGNGISCYSLHKDLKLDWWFECIKRPDGNIHGIAFDPLTDTVFFTDTIERTVNWFSIEKSIEYFRHKSSKTVHHDNFYNEYDHDSRGYRLIKMDKGIPRDIAVDSCKEYVYWLNTDMKNPRIERARFSGAEREVFVHTTSLSFNATHTLEPHSLAIDHRTQAIFWFEPYSATQYNMVRCDMNTRNKTVYLVYYEMERFPMIAHPSNTLTISNGLFYSVELHNSRTKVKIFPLILNDYKSPKELLLFNKTNVGIAVRKYDIQEIQDCEISSINSERMGANKTFCVYGYKAAGQSVCTCRKGYSGEKCEVYDFYNYCLHGRCRVINGLPECSCAPGYTGARCQINSCDGYCLNGGECSLIEEDRRGRPKTVCQCVGGYTGSRCEAVKTDSLYTTSCSEAGDITLSDLFSSLQKSENKTICLKTI